MFPAYEEIRVFHSTISNPFYPNVRAGSDELAGSVVCLKHSVKPEYV